MATRAADEVVKRFERVSSLVERHDEDDQSGDPGDEESDSDPSAEEVLRENVVREVHR